MKEQKRSAGILMPISSLASSYGIGALGREAYAFVDFLKGAGQTYWQVLPLGHTSYGDSPYQSFSAFAGNPYFIDIDSLVEEGLLNKKDVRGVKRAERAERIERATQAERDESAAQYIDYQELYLERYKLLRVAFSNFDRRSMEYLDFCEEHREWLEDYALFMALKLHFNQRDLMQWEKAVRLREPDTMEYYKRKLSVEIEFWRFVQFYFFKQWFKLKKYANDKGIRIIGDIPIYVSGDSADVFANRELFQMDEDGLPTNVAGVPPDYFSEEGQLWGNPLYDWEQMEKDGFDWWSKRIKASARLYDVIRIDHFIGIARYYSIKYGDKNAKKGKWIKGPGKKLIDVINVARGEAGIIAEDLGVLHPSVERLLDYSGYPGMKVLIFAENDAENPYIPYKYDKNTIVYVGTHDNDTAVGFCEERTEEELSFLMDYFRVKRKEDLPEALICGAYESAGQVVIIQMQDWLAKGSSARMNVPSTVGLNWRWRLKKGELTNALQKKIYRIAKLYGRLNDEGD